jgi:hypothetical protein
MVLFFFLSILSCSQIGNHLEDGQTKFGYRPYMKIQKKEIFLYFGYLLKPLNFFW